MSVAAEIRAAQAALNLYPDASPYWDSAAGQDTLDVAKAYGLKPTNTNADRITAHAEFRRSLYNRE